MRAPFFIVLCRIFPNPGLLSYPLSHQLYGAEFYLSETSFFCHFLIDFFFRVKQTFSSHLQCTLYIHTLCSCDYVIIVVIWMTKSRLYWRRHLSCFTQYFQYSACSSHLDLQDAIFAIFQLLFFPALMVSNLKFLINYISNKVV